MKKYCYKKTLPIFLLALACICLPLLGFAGESTEPKHIKERITTSDGFYLDLDMTEPPSVPKTLPQYKMERIHFDLTFIKELLAQKYGVQASKGESWELWVNQDLNPDIEILYAEENGRYGATRYGDAFPKTLLDENDSTLVKASNTVKNFLDELGLLYEYPFHVVRFDDLENVISPLVLVVPRLSIEGFSCHTGSGWTKDSKTGPESNGDPTPMCTFTVTKEGKLANIMLQNPVKVLKSKEDTRPIKNWREVLENDIDHLMQYFYLDENPPSSLVLKSVELLMMVDAHQIAYPAWVYSFDLDFPGKDSENLDYLQLTYDARTGERTWMR